MEFHIDGNRPICLSVRECVMFQTEDKTEAFSVFSLTKCSRKMKVRFVRLRCCIIKVFYAIKTSGSLKHKLER